MEKRSKDQACLILFHTHYLKVILSTDYAIWKIIVNGLEVPKKIVEGQQVPKTEEEWNVEDLKKVELNAKAINI